jgi:hypothetical protein
MEHITFLKGVCGKLVLITMTLLIFGSLFVTSGNSDRKHTVSLLCYWRPLHNIIFLQQRAMPGLQHNSIYTSEVYSINLKNYSSPCAYDDKYFRNGGTAPCLLNCSTNREVKKKSTGTNWIRSWVSPGASLDTLAKRKISYHATNQTAIPCLSNPYSSHYPDKYHTHLFWNIYNETIP